jgi:hypothetical protein
MKKEKGLGLTLKEMCYIVAVFGNDDIPLWKRVQLYQQSSLPAQAGPGVFQAGQDFVDRMRRSRIHPVLRTL